MRAAGLRSLRYLIRDTAVLQKVLRLQVDYLIARWVTPVGWRSPTGLNNIPFYGRSAPFWNTVLPSHLLFSCWHISVSPPGWTDMTNYFSLLVFRCIDIQQSNEGERTQALRLVRKVIIIRLFVYHICTSSVILPLIDSSSCRERNFPSALARAITEIIGLAAVSLCGRFAQVCRRGYL